MNDLGPITHEACPKQGVRWHEYAEIFPWLEGKARQELAEDIKINGVIEPIVFFGDAILDGRNRYDIARELGLTYPRADFVGNDPLAFVISKNLHRRHLTDRQRADIAAKLAKMPRGRPAENPSIEGITTAQAAKIMEVPVAAVERSKAIDEYGAPELKEAYQAGKVSQSAAAEIAKLPPEEQVEVVSKDEAAAKAKELREKRKAEKQAQQAEFDRQREENRAKLNPAIQAAEEAKHQAVANKKQNSTDTGLSAEDRVAELEAANSSLELELLQAKALISEFEDLKEMHADWKAGGWEKAIEGIKAGHTEIVHALESRLYRESEDKASWMRSAKYWQAEAKKLGWSKDIVIDIETGEVVNG